MAQYLTQDEYAAMGGAEMDAQSFDRHEFLARKAVDGPTFGRVRGEGVQRGAVKRLVYELVGLYAANEASLRRQQDGGNVSGWSNDGVSLSVEPAAPLTAMALELEADGLVRALLRDERDPAGTPLLYRGRERKCP